MRDHRKTNFKFGNNPMKTIEQSSINVTCISPIKPSPLATPAANPKLTLNSSYIVGMNQPQKALNTLPVDHRPSTSQPLGRKPHSHAPSGLFNNTIADRIK